MPITKMSWWVVSGVTAVAGVAAYVYIRKWRSEGNKVSKAFEGIGRKGLRSGRRERKMVFVVNRPLLSNKQMLFLSVSSACLRYYRLVLDDREYYEAHLEPWTRTGQMKVVLKADSGDELQSLVERCRKERIEALVLNVADFVPNGKDKASEKENVSRRENASEKENGSGKKITHKGKNENDSLAGHDPGTPVVFCALAPAKELDRITGHLKLL